MTVRLRARLERNWETRRGARPENAPGEWRHRGITARRTAYFPRPAATGHGCVLYHRYDGHYGLVTATPGSR